jgi:4-amino-4-deoxy-L-arabinose transferase-like glycosyltransferase
MLMAQSTRTEANRRWLEGLALALILLLAAYLRLESPGVVEFKRDEANLSRLALDLARGRDFPLLGIGSSVGIPNAPVNTYILSIPYLFTSNPQVATQFVGLLNVVAAALIYLLARRYCGPGFALLAVLLFAVNPWAVAFSRKIWAQNMLPPFVLLTVGTGLAGLLQRRRWAQFAHLPLLSLTGQIHYGAFVILPVTLYLLWQGKRRVTREFAAGFVVALLLALPYAAGIIRAGLDHPDALLSTVSEDASGLALTGAPWQGFALLLSGADIHALAGPRAFEEYLSQVPAAHPLLYLPVIAVGLSGVWLLVRSLLRPDDRTPLDVTVLIWLVFPPLAFSLTWTPFHLHYLIPALPAAVLGLGIGMKDVWDALVASPRIRFAAVGSGVAVFGVVAIFHVWLWLALVDFVDTHDTPGGFGTPLHYLLEVREAILEAEPQEVIARVGGQAVGIDDEATVWDFLLDDVPLVRFEDASTWVYPAEDVLYLAHGCEGDGRRFELRPGEGCYMLSDRSREGFELTGFLPVGDGIERVRFANGAELVSYRVTHDARTCLELAWRITSRAEEDYLFAVHFFDDRGERIAQADGLSWLGRFWRPGDLVVREFCLPDVQSEAARVGIGMYTYDGVDFYNVDLLDEAGAPAGQMAELPLP